MDDWSWIGPVATIASVIVAIWISNRNIAHEQKVQSEKLTAELSTKVAVLSEKITAFSDRVSTFEKHIQNQINDLKIRLGEIEREMKREKSR